MNKNIQTVLRYHQQTKHSQQRYARSLGYMDWETQPNPFREYAGAESITLPLAFEHSTPPYHLLESDLPSAPLLAESISQLLQFSMGIAAWKVSGSSSWAVRCNASSGNLHPTETYLILPPIFKEQNAQTSVFHYTPKNHALEKLASFTTSFWETLPKGSFLVGFSSIAWREVWKYGERAFRYVNLDAGHAWQSLNVSAKMLGWKLTKLDTISDADIETLLGLSQEQRFSERERGDMLFILSPQEINSTVNLESLLQETPLVFNSIANRLSPKMHEWDIIPQIQEATLVTPLAQKNLQKALVEKKASLESKEVVLQRRSVHVMDTESSLIKEEQFHSLLLGVTNSLHAQVNAAHLVIFVHRVQGYDSGLYILVRNEIHKEHLQSEMHSAFEWGTTTLDALYLLEKRDLKMASKAISCSQDIASDGAFSLGMLCSFSQEILEFGAHRYKELYWECGAIGQQLYLDATSMGLSGTGIGCFLDDTMHSLLGLKTERFQILYHFTVGRGYVDSRIESREAYKRDE